MNPSKSVCLAALLALALSLPRHCRAEISATYSHEVYADASINNADVLDHPQSKYKTSPAAGQFTQNVTQTASVSGHTSQATANQDTTITSQPSDLLITGTASAITSLQTQSGFNGSYSVNATSYLESFITVTKPTPFSLNVTANGDGAGVILSGGALYEFVVGKTGSVTGTLIPGVVYRLDAYAIDLFEAANVAGQFSKGNQYNLSFTFHAVDISQLVGQYAGILRHRVSIAYAEAGAVAKQKITGRVAPDGTVFLFTSQNQIIVANLLPGNLARIRISDAGAILPATVAVKGRQLKLTASQSSDVSDELAAFTQLDEYEFALTRVSQ